jgi:UDP-N-acetylglucosamine 4,6-dehydratase
MNINGTILITGGSGSWGRELTKQLLDMNPERIIIFSRGEISQVAMERSFNNPKLEFVIGDVRDEWAVDQVMKGVDYVFHLAALKHVPICENHPQEAIQTNIIGTKNLINSAVKNRVRKFIDVSTDKAVNPINFYGYTKGVGERLSIQANSMTKDTDFICVRGGNVLGTNGSVVPYIIDQIKTGEVLVTDKRMTRFFLTLPQAIKLLFQATELGVGGETFVMNMPSFYILDLVELLIEYYGAAKIREIGAREGEKIHEILVSENEVDRTWRISDDYYVIYPQIKTGRMYPYLGDGYLPKHGLTSKDNLKDKEYLRNLLKLGGWLQ